MKKFLKILVTIILVLFVATIALGYYSYSKAKVVDGVMEASYQHYKSQGSMVGFCSNTALETARESGYKVACSEQEEIINLSLEYGNNLYLCRNGTAGKDDMGNLNKGIVCMKSKLPELLDQSLKGASVSQDQPDSLNLPALNYDETQAVTTLVKEPPLCPKDGNDFVEIRENVDEVYYSVMPGPYANFSIEGGRGVFLAVNEDRSVCTCGQRDNFAEVSAFQYGVISKEGFIDWDEDKSWKAEPGSWDIRQAINTLYTTRKESSGKTHDTTRSMYLDNQGCGEWESVWSNRSSWNHGDVTSAQICNCGNRGI